jgi:tetratricopeptide (TPR) repeat protein
MKSYNSAVESYNSKDYHSALNLVSTFIDSMPQARGYVLKGLCLLKLNRYEEAIKFAALGLNGATSEDRDNANNCIFYSYRALGIQALEKKDYQKAISYLDQSISTKPNESDVYIFKASCLGSLDKYNEAIQSATLGLNFATSNEERNHASYCISQFFHVLGVQAFNSKCYKEAIIRFDSAIEHYDSEVIFYHNRAKCLYNLHRYDEAIGCIKRALGMDISSEQKNDLFALMSGVYEILGDKAKEEKDYQKALSYYNQGIEKTPKRSGLYIYKTFCLLQLEKLEEALDSANMARNNAISRQEIDSADNCISATFYALGWKAIDQKLFQKALDYFNKAIEKSSKVDVQLYLGRALSFLSLDEYDKALSDASVECITTSDKELAKHIKSRAFYALGMQKLSNESSSKEALSYLNRAISEKIDEADFYISKALCHYLLEEYDEALKSVSKVHSLCSPTIEQIQNADNILARIYNSLGTESLRNRLFEKASDFFSQALAKTSLKEEKAKYYVNKIICLSELKKYKNLLECVKEANLLPLKGDQKIQLSRFKLCAEEELRKESEAEEFIKTGQKLLNEGENIGALDCFKKAFALNQQEKYLLYIKQAEIKIESDKKIDNLVKLANKEFANSKYESGFSILEQAFAKSEKKKQKEVQQYIDQYKVQEKTYLAKKEEEIARIKKKALEERAESNYFECLSLKEEGKYEQAAALINKTIKLLPLKKYIEFDKSLKNELLMISGFRTQGKDAYDNGEWESSLKFFQQVLSKQSDDKLSLLYFQKASAFLDLSKERFSDAASKFKELLSIQSRDKEVLVGLSKSLIKLEKYDDAILYLDSTGDNDPNINKLKLEASKGYIIKCLNEASYLEAMNVCDKLIKFTEGEVRAEVIANKSMICMKLGQYDEAQKGLEDAVSIVPQREDFKIMLSAVYNMKGEQFLTNSDFSNAKKYFDLALINDRSNVIYKNNLAKILLNENSYERVLDILKVAEEKEYIESEKQIFTSTLTEALKALTKVSKSKDDIKEYYYQLTELHPKNGQYFYEYAKFLVDNNYEAKIYAPLIRQGHNIDPDNQDIIQLAGDQGMDL